ncbi:MAG: hypothetical protein AABX25_04180, partial [Nanoarchaeota archaeon]
MEGLEILDCDGCQSLTTIPNIEGLKELYCYNCPLLTTIPNIEGLKYLDCDGCQSLTTIPNIEGLKELYCYNCPLLIYIPNIKKIIYNENLFKLSYEGCKYLISKKIDNLYNNIYYLWKSYKLKKYAFYLEMYIYSNPRLPYMKYYIENELYDE